MVALQVLKVILVVLFLKICPIQQLVRLKKEGLHHSAFICHLFDLSSFFIRELLVILVKVIYIIDAADMRIQSGRKSKIRNVIVNQQHQKTYHRFFRLQNCWHRVTGRRKVFFVEQQRYFSQIFFQKNDGSTR